MADKILTVDQLIDLLKKYKHTELHAHHTWKPEHKNFNGSNHLVLQRGMRNYHMNSLGWGDIGQHVTLMPDGKFVTGRSFSSQPASIKGYNRIKGGIPFMVEMLGNFDIGHDKFTGPQKASMLKLARYFDNKGRYIRFHRENAAKTCPGTSIDKTQFMREVRSGAPIKPTTNSTSKTSTTKSYTTLKRGSGGSQVKFLQMNLNVLAYKCGNIDGSYGPGTESAVRRFQKAYGLSADGMAGKNTLNRINSIITDVQSKLKKIGHNIAADGIAGNNTVKAVKAFQKSVGITVDGLIGKNTINKLNNAVKNNSNNNKKKSNSKLYRVQVGAFGSLENADRLEKKLRKEGYKPFITHNKGLYKVQIGAFSVKDNALKLKKELNKKGYDVFIA